MQHRSSGSPLNVPNVSPTIQESQPQNEDDHLEINVSILNEVPAISSSNLKFKLFPETPFLALLLSLVIIYGVRFSIIRSEGFQKCYLKILTRFFFFLLFLKKFLMKERFI